ncbi:MAG: ATP phosphoribosyltransferase regulatory subunit [Clostridia bacterium]|nr:ATP phosphoribosyltransferase regulatory subunit [Clostridia bacterium]
MNGSFTASKNIFKTEERVTLALRGLYRAFGYKPYKMSKFEEYDLYVRNKDFLVSDRVITFTGESGKLLALKPDVTLSIIKNTPESPSGINKIYYNETVYRSSGASGSKDFSEIMQTGLECFGKLDSYNVCEVIMLALRSLATVSDKYILDISHMGILSSLIEEAGLSGELKRKILVCISEKNRSGVASVCEEAGLDADLKDCFAKLVSAYGKIEDVISPLGEICRTEKAREALDELTLICEMTKKCGVADHVWIDFSVVNDMRYYSGIVFRGFIDNIPTGVLSGGRYDNLLSKMGREGGAIGFAVYLDLLERLDRTSADCDADIFLVYGENNSPADVFAAVEKLTASGESLMSGREVPENMTFKQVVDMRNGGEI